MIQKPWAMSNAGFVHLHVHSAYSLLKGSIKIAKLGELAKADRQPALALTDTDNMFGALEFSDKVAGYGIQPIIGCELAVDFGDQDPNARNALAAAPARIVLLAADGIGTNEIVRRTGVSKPTVILWKQRYGAEGGGGLEDRPRPGKPRTTDDVAVVLATLEPPPKRLGVTHWSSRLLAAERPLLISSYAGRNHATVALLDELARFAGIRVVEFNPLYVNLPHDSPCHGGFMPAKALAEHPNPARAAIAPALAAEIYGLDILARDIEDEHHNTTRFLVMTADRDPLGVDAEFDGVDGRPGQRRVRVVQC